MATISTSDFMGDGAPESIQPLNTESFSAGGDLTPVTDAPSRQASIVGTMGDVAQGALQGAEGLGAGFVKEAGNLASGAVALPIEAASAVNKYLAPKLGIQKGGDVVSSKLDQAAQAIRQYGSKISDVGRMTQGTIASTDSTMGGAGSAVGGFAADTAALLAPSAGITKAQSLLEGGAMPLIKAAQSIPWLGKALGYGIEMAAHVAPEAATGFGFGKVKGEDNATAGLDALLFGTASGLGKAAGDAVTAWKGTIEDNVMQALGTNGKQSIGQALAGPKKAVQAFKTIYDVAKTNAIKVMEDGVEKVFDPAHATIADMAQALYQTKKIIYDAYTTLAKKAGDKGAVFSGKDFERIYNSLGSHIQNSTSALKDASKSIFNDMVQNYGKVVTKAGKETVQFRDIALEDIQSFLENLNKTVDPRSKGALQAASETATKEIRAILDEKIMNATGEGFQVIRDQYGSLKSIENQIVKQFNKTNAQRAGGVSDYVQGFGALDTIVGGLTGNWVKAGKGIGQIALGALTAHLRDPETYIKRVFQAFQDAEAGKGAGGAIYNRFFGTGAGAKAASEAVSTGGK